MIDRDPVPPAAGSVTAPSANQTRAIVFRRAAMTTEHVARFVFLLLREIACDPVRYDAFHLAFAESGLQPRPSPRRECAEHHLETEIERINRLADVLLTRISEDEAVHGSICSMAIAVLNELTMPAPAEHATDAQLRTFLACCSGASGPHLVHYDVYAARYAHLGSCADCQRRLNELAMEP